MSATTVRGAQVRDATIQRADVDVSTAGQALIRKLVQGRGSDVSGDGADAGTGDVTVKGKLVRNASISPQTISGATDTYLTGSGLTVPAGDLAQVCSYKASIYISKTALGSAAGQLVFRIGTLGSISDLAISTFALPAGTAVADVGFMEFYGSFQAVGGSAIVNAFLNLRHNNTAAGLWNLTTLSTLTASMVASSPFSSSAATKLGLSYHGGLSANHQLLVVDAELVYP